MQSSERFCTPLPHVSEQPDHGFLWYTQSVTVGTELGLGVSKAVASVGVSAGPAVGQTGTAAHGVIVGAQPPQRLEVTAC